MRSSIRGHEPNDEAMAVEQEWTNFFHLTAFACPCEQIYLFPDGTRGRQVTRVVEGTLAAGKKTVTGLKGGRLGL